jgi:hypothetical protein
MSCKDKGRADRRVSQVRESPARENLRGFVGARSSVEDQRVKDEFRACSV